MDTADIVSAIDRQIEKLQQARALLVDPATQTKKRHFSPEALARIRAAQKKRWAALKRAAKNGR